MGITKRQIADYLMLTLLVIFPFGQLPGIFLENIFDLPFRVHILDIILVFMILFTINIKDLTRLVVKYKYVFIVLGFGSLVSFSQSYFSFTGILYLFRLIFYLLFLLKLLDSPFELKFANLILKSILLVGIAISAFGWIQYLLLPNLIDLKYFGWDDHYFRLAGSFLDPAFTGIILALSTLLSIHFYIVSRSSKYIISTLILLITLGFTYSRASFLAFSVGLLFLLFKKQKKLLTLLCTFLLVMIPLLPRTSGGEGVKLTRTASSIQKVENYKDSLKLIARAPLFGVGYNNICKAKEDLGIDISKQENSCSGLDNSFMFIFATTGILGSMSFAFFVIKSYPVFNKNKLVIASMSAIAVHSFFTNTLFYPWVLIWFSLLLGARNALRSKL